jgi:hypothetical protein
MLKPHKDGYYPKAGDEQKFVDKHVVTKIKHLGGKATEDDQLFQATNIKTGKREEEHGYDADKSDQKMYEQTKKKKTSVLKKMKNKAIGAILGKDYKYLAQGDSRGMENNINDLNEATAKDLYNMHHQRVKELLKGINQGLEIHKKACGDKCHYGHAGDMKHFANALQDMHDQLHMQGEYAKPQQLMPMKEELKQVDEKTLTSAEMKKREEVARAIERENPKMPMAKKMAIATTTAKRVAEQKTFAQFMIEAMGANVTLHVKPHPDKKGHHVVVKSSDPERFETGETVSREELEQGQDDGYLKVKHVKG